VVTDVTAIILARGGSKGIVGKNLARVLGRPLIDWTILQLQAAGISRIFVSTDSRQIAARASSLGADTIDRPTELAGDDSQGDDSLVHAAEALGLTDDAIILCPQLTSPLRYPSDFVEAVIEFEFKRLDSLFSAVAFDDLCLWENSTPMKAVSYTPNNRKNRQDRAPQLVENGSFYIMTAQGLLCSRNRLHGKIGTALMPKWTLPEIDDSSDLKLCEALMMAYDIPGKLTTLQNEHSITEST